jgi:TonB family protein
MTASLALNNLLIWSLQIGLLVALAAVLPPLLRLRMPNAKLIFWQLVLAACLLLPFMRSWKQGAAGGAVEVSTSIVALAPDPAASRFSLSPMASVLLLLEAGILIRFGLLFAGFLRLRRYRRQSRPLAPASPWGAEADLRISEETAGPVTFGFRRPVVLLPAQFAAMGEPMRDAILCHEILHIRRNDWLFTVAEEFVRALLWFHPAVWWLLGEIQLIREQAVDREVVRMMRSRDQYIDALLVIAGRPQLDLAPAPLFLRRRHLKQRVVSILKEVQMSRAKSISALAASLAMLAVSCWLVTGTFRLEAAPQIEADASGVSVDTNGAPLMHRRPVTYPPEAIAKGVQGTVAVQVKLDSAGNVSDASVVSGPEELRRPVLESVLSWHFSPDAANSARQIAIAFALPQNAATQPAAVGAATPGPAPPAQPTVLKNITVAGLSDRQRDELVAQLPVHLGDTVDESAIRRLGQAIHAFDEHLVFAVDGSGMLSIATPEVQRTASLPAIRVGGNAAANNLVTKVTPVYPPLAKVARVQGTVRFEATIGTDGTVLNLHLVSGPPLLAQAAMEAVRQWVYRPTLLNGNPVNVITMVDINFTLSE